MRFLRCVRLASLLTGTIFFLGCTNKPTSMPNMVPGTGPGEQREIKTKKVVKPIPYEPPSPKAPP